jgi:uncharacterized protein (TIGR00251 family)
LKIKVKVKPNSRENTVKEISKDYYEVRVTVPPEKGKANERVIKLLSDHLGIAKSRILIEKGQKSKEKIVEIN